MGYRLSGVPVYADNKTELISSAVSFGTIQLLPDGQLIVLMADHQTAGGYPRLAHVISAHLPQLAQVRPGEKIQFQLTDIAAAEQLFYQQKHHLLQLQNACKFRLEEFLNA
jgi:antagonist of KipI